MVYRIAPGIQVSVDGGSTWYKLTDHNRQPFKFSYEIIESSQRMANGTMRKYIVAKKTKINIDWTDVPTLDSNTVDYSSGTKGAAWIKAFYEGNVFVPIKIKVTHAAETPVSTPNTIQSDSTYKDSATSTGVVYNCYITSFTYDVIKRMVPTNSSVGYDYVSLSIEFTEI
jgi:hypothetical protein